MDTTSTSVSQHSHHNQPQVDVVEIRTEMPSHTPSEPSSPAQLLNLPNGDLLARRDEYLCTGVRLYEASVKGDWERAKAIFNRRPEVVQCAITENYDTVLHIAASAKSTKLAEKFVKNLVNLMTPGDLLLQNRSGNTAFSLAAAAGTIGIAKILLEKNPGVVNISDVALKMVTDNPELAINENLLQILARKEINLHPIFGVIGPKLPTPYETSLVGLLFSYTADSDSNIRHAEKENHAMQLLKIIWREIVKRPKPEVDAILRGPADIAGQDTAERVKFSSGVLFIAAEKGNTKFIVELIRQYPDLIWQVNDKNQSIFHVAVSHRQEGIYNLLYEIGSLKDLVTTLTDEDGNNMLHLAGMSAKNKRLQVALQMQRELLWYKEVEGMVPPSYREMKNKDGLLPHELFTKEHEDLLSASEKWMKDTASQSMVVAALIATIVFAAAFTIPGGYNQDNGIPILLRNRAFIVFVLSDAISLALATTAILVFLHIHTSCYAEKDFLESLPEQLTFGLATLFLSILTMMVAFNASFFVLYDKELHWVPILITCFAYWPLFVYYELLTDVYLSRYGSTKLFNPEKHVLYF